jgi:multiple sugar transport system permease protein
VVAATGPRRRGPRAGQREHLAGWAFALPATVLIAVFGLAPVGWSLLLSFQHNDLLSPPAWVGLGNYRALARDPLFRGAIRHTLVYTALFVPISIVGALGIAVALNRKVGLIRLYRTAVFVPVVFSTVATAITFNWLLEPNYGLVDYGLEKVGLPAQGFFQDPNQALYAIVAMTVWGWLGFDVIIYLAALQSIPRELLEAAAIDGAGRWVTFRRVVVPLLGPATLFLVVWSTINALQLFDEVYVATRGGPLHATNVVVYYLFDQAFHFFSGGYAAAIAYTLFVAILALTGLQLWIGSRRVHYGSS